MLSSEVCCCLGDSAHQTPTAPDVSVRKLQYSARASASGRKRLFITACVNAMRSRGVCGAGAQEPEGPASAALRLSAAACDIGALLTSSLHRPKKTAEESGFGAASVLLSNALSPSKGTHLLKALATLESCSIQSIAHAYSV